MSPAWRGRSKIQAPRSRERPTPKKQSSWRWVGSLRIGSSLEFGSWSLELPLGGGQRREVAINLQALGLALFRVKLRREHPAARDRRAKAAAIIALRQGQRGIGGHAMEAVHEIKCLALGLQTDAEGGMRLHEANRVPAHVWNLVVAGTL